MKRLVARELILSFVPDVEQRLWRAVTRKKYQLRRDRVRLQSQLEALLEEAHIKLSSLVTDLLGLSAQRMLQATSQCRELGIARFLFVRNPWTPQRHGSMNGHVGALGCTLRGAAWI